MRRFWLSYPEPNKGYRITTKHWTENAGFCPISLMGGHEALGNLS